MISFRSLWLLLFVFVCGGCVVRSTVVASDGSAVSVGVFYDALAPYGEWIYVGNYGRVWRPSVAVVGVGFRPYGPGGHWVYTDYGWSFESDWSWGWAPMPPAGAAIVVETYHPYWCFVETRYLVARDVYHYAMPPQSYHAAFNATVAVHQTQSVGGARWNAAPPAGQVSRDIGQPIHTASISPPPPGSVQAHRISAQPVAPGSPAHPPPGPHGAAPGQSVEHPSRAPERGEAEGHEVDREQPRHAEHEGNHEGKEKPEAQASHAASQSHPQAPPPRPAVKRKRK